MSREESKYDLGLAFEIIEAMREQGYVVQLDNGLDSTWECQFYKPTATLNVIKNAEGGISVEKSYGCGHTLLKAVQKSKEAAQPTA